MSKYSDSRQCEVLLSIQSALLGEISASLRVITISWDEKNVKFVSVFDGPISDEDKESMSCVETELIADLPEDNNIAYQMIRIDAPQRVVAEGVWVYARRESLEQD